MSTVPVLDAPQNAIDVDAEPLTVFQKPTHKIETAYYFDSSKRFGDFSTEIGRSASVRYLWCFRYAAEADDPPEVWIPDLVASAKDAVRDGQKLHLNIDLTWPTPVRDVLKALEPYKDHFTVIEIGDEPKWNRAGTTQQCKNVRTDLRAMGWPNLPLMVTYSTKQFPVRQGKIPPYDAVDIIGVEAYREAPGDHNAKYNADLLAIYLKKALAVVEKAKKRAIVIPQAYSRNYTWRYIGNPDPKKWTGPYLEPGSDAWKQAVKTMVALIKPAYDAAVGSKSVVGLYSFSYGRNAGAREYPALKREVLRAGLACRI